MAESYPSVLQDKLNTASFTYVLGTATLRSDVEVGPAKLRNRYTGNVDPVRGSIDLTYTEYTDLVNFYKVTLANGSKSFNFDHPFTGVEEEFRFVEPPSISPKGSGGREFVVSFTWEQLP
jgi:hypothetical protein